MLDKFLRLKKEKNKESKKPFHIAITIKGHYVWAKKHDKDLLEVYRKGFGIIRDVIKSQLKNEVPILTLYLLSENLPGTERFEPYTEALVEFLKILKEDDILHDNKIRVSIFGKWYDLEGKIVEPIKSLIKSTADYDNRFLNLCINYNGQEEIVDACKIIARKVLTDRIDPSSINKDLVKESLYSSSFLAPDLIIITAPLRKLSGLLLWDSAYSTVYFTNKLWPEFKEDDLQEAIRFYQKDREIS